MTLAIRNATTEDAPFLAWVVLAATRSHRSRGWFDISFELPEAELLALIERLIRAQARSLWHFSYFFVATIDGTPAAALAAFRGEDAFPLADAAIGEAVQSLGWGRAEIAEIDARGAYLMTCLSDNAPDAWIIENVATRPEFRGRGAAGALIKHALGVGRDRGHKIAQLMELIGNTKAQRVYEREGFAVAAEKRTPEFEALTGAPGLAQLRCLL